MAVRSGFARSAATVLGVVAVSVAIGWIAYGMSHEPPPPPSIREAPEPPREPPVLTEEQLAARGERQLAPMACTACHSIDGPAGDAPSLRGICWGRTRRDASGAERIVDEAYIRESLMNPGAFVVAGYEHVRMPAGRYADVQIDAIIAYMRRPAPEVGERWLGVYASANGETFAATREGTFELRASPQCGSPTRMLVGTTARADEPWQPAEPRTIEAVPCAARTRPAPTRPFRHSGSLRVTRCDDQLPSECIRIDGTVFPFDARATSESLQRTP